MKLTDLSLIFIGVLLPIIIIVYVNVSYTIKAEEQEMYYQRIINIATKDAANQMKEIENSDLSIDYGYSGNKNNKVSINPQVAIDTFFSNLYSNFNIEGNTAAEDYLKTFIPAVAIIDYDGVYIASKDNDEYNLRPKKYYSYTYSIVGNEIKEGIYTSGSVHTVEFTMDDYITHRGTNDVEPKSFYLKDDLNNRVLYNNNESIKDEVLTHLESVRKQVIIDKILAEFNFAINKANIYAKNLGINYEFSIPTITEDEMENAIQNIGVFAFIQGINLGNKYLNTKSYSMTKLEETVKYYFSIPKEDNSKFKMNLYHINSNCPEYLLSYHNGDSNNTKITPAYVLTKQEAAATIAVYNDTDYTGFYPCPVCNP